MNVIKKLPNLTGRQPHSVYNRQPNTERAAPNTEQSHYPVPPPDGRRGVAVVPHCAEVALLLLMMVLIAVIVAARI